MEMANSLSKYQEFLIHRIDGKEYVGRFENGLLHGECVFTEKNGKPKKGIWENGTRSKWL